MKQRLNNINILKDAKLPSVDRESNFILFLFRIKLASPKINFDFSTFLSEVIPLFLASLSGILIIGIVLGNRFLFINALVTENQKYCYHFSCNHSFLTNYYPR